MEEVHIESHRFTKQNLVTKSNRKGTYDEYKCKDCGLSGRRYGLSGYVTVKKNKQCSFSPTIPKEITITRCNAVGPQFENLTPGSKHMVIEPPHGYLNSHSGVWVMGIGEPVKVLRGEYTF